MTTRENNIGDIMFKESVKYNFTVTLCPLLYSKDPIEQLLSTQHKLLELLRELHIMNVTFVYELTTTMNIHYHGVFTVNLAHYKRSLVVNKFYNLFRKKDNRKLFGSTRCYQTEHETESLNYLKKSLYESYALLDRKIYPILRDDFKIHDHFYFQEEFANWRITAKQQFKEFIYGCSQDDTLLRILQDENFIPE